MNKSAPIYFLLPKTMESSWSNQILRWLKERLKVNLISAIWFVWAVLSSTLFIVFLGRGIIRTVIDDGFQGLLDLDTHLIKLVTPNSWFTAILFWTLIIGGILGIGWLIIGIAKWILDRVQGLMGGQDQPSS